MKCDLMHYVISKQDVSIQFSLFAGKEGGAGTLGPLKLPDLQPGGQLQLSFRAHMAAAGQVAMGARLACTDAQVQL